MKQLIVRMLAVLFLASCAVAQDTSTGPTSITSNQCASIGLSAATSSTVAISVTGTWTGTLQPQVVVRGQSAVNTTVTPAGSSTPQSTVTANGVYTANVSGMNTFFLCGNTVSSGSATVYLNNSQAKAGSVSSGGGSGTVTSSGPPVAGNIPKFTTSTNIAPAVAADLIVLWSGTCDATHYLRGDGSCAAPAGSGTVTNIATTSPVSGGPITTTGTISCPTCAIGPGSSVTNHLAKFSGTDGLSLADGGAIPAGTVTSVGHTVNGGSSSGIFSITGSPVTTSGTLDLATAGTSGGIPYFSSASVVSSSSALTSNVLVKGGGAGAAPTVSSVTDNGTTVSTTEAIQTIAGTVSSSPVNGIQIGGATPGLAAGTSTSLSIQVGNGVATGTLDMRAGSAQFWSIGTASSGASLTYAPGVNANVVSTIAGLNKTQTSASSPALLLGSEAGNNGSMTATSGTTSGVNFGAGSTGGNGGLRFAPTSGTANFNAVSILPQINQTGGANGNYIALLVNPTETAVGGTGRLIDLQAGGTSKFAVNNKGNIFTAGTNSVAATVSTSASTTASVSFTNAFTSTPVCTLTPQTTGLTSWYLSAISNTGFTVTVAPSGTYTFGFHCMGNPN